MNWSSDLQPILPPNRTPDGVSPDAAIRGFAIELPDGWNDNAQQTINDVTATIATADPFDNNSLISQLHDGEEGGVIERDND